MRRIPFFLVCLSCLVFCVALQAQEKEKEKPLHHFLAIEDKSNVSLAYQWVDIAQEATAREVDAHGARPTILSRTLAIWATAMYDAWTAYDEKAVGSRLGGALRRPAEERTLENKKKAISYASYQSLLFCYPDAKDYLAGEMRRFGYDPRIVSLDPTRPEGIGNLAAQAVIEYRRHDGANQFGDEAGGDGTPYGDYTYYVPVNPPDKIIDPDRWQPITFTLANGKKITPGFLTPHWYRVKPFVMESSSQFRPAPPPKTTTDDATLRKEADQVLAYNAGLTKQQKAIVEFMRDGPRSTGQSGHWLRFAQDVSRRDKHDLDKDVKLYFAIANVAFDAFISCWETKRAYDSSRPWTLIHYYHRGEKVTGWAGPAGGVKEMPAEQWHPYSPETFITPPFPGYTSGHATVSGACSKTLELFTGSDGYGFCEKRKHCDLTETSGGEMMTIDLPTWSATAEIAALSRALGGYHIPIDNNVGLKVGRELATWSWPRYQAYFDGTARVRD
ncbi:MAG TPA: vanadium-dependent haloperoxidase [Thermoanaerobaculia bacterium]|nr:vanadium-dependent haloperoxidase [Thermoanaerobaculia bacterium]